MGEREKENPSLCTFSHCVGVSQLFQKAKKVIISTAPTDPIRSAEISEVAKQFGERLQQSLSALRVTPTTAREKAVAVRLLDHLGESSRQLGVICTGRYARLHEKRERECRHKLSAIRTDERSPSQRLTVS